MPLMSLCIVEEEFSKVKGLLIRRSTLNALLENICHRIEKECIELREPDHDLAKDDVVPDRDCDGYLVPQDPPADAFGGGDPGGDIPF